MKKSSEQYRQHGNEFLAKLKQDEHAAPVLRQGRFADALKCYNQAVSVSLNNDERASAYKNLGVLFAYQIGNIDVQTVNQKDLNYNLKECITSYGHAFEFGKKTKSDDWLIAICHQINSFIYDCCANFLMISAEERIHVLLFVVNCFERTALEKLDSLATVYYTLGQLTFEKAVSRFKEEPQLIYECRPHLDRALYWACVSDKFRSDEIEELQRSIWLHQCIYESSNARRTGIRMLEAHLNNDEHLSMDIIWIVIDKFRQAILLAKEHDIEGEAQACHHTAKVYQNVLKMADLAYTYHLRCVTLAQTLVPRNLTSLDWYVASSLFVQQYRAKKELEEAVISEEHNRRFRVELESELSELNKKASESAYKFIEYIYEKHPPRKENAKMSSTDSSELSKTCKKAITHYHPDAQSSFNDEKWTFLCGEITKILNLKYALLDN